MTTAALVAGAGCSPAPSSGTQNGATPQFDSALSSPLVDQGQTQLEAFSVLPQASPETSPAPLLPIGPPAPQLRTFTAAFTGDMLLHNRVNRTAQTLGNSDSDDDLEYDYRPLLAPIEPWLQAADWAVCHMEVPLSADNTRLRPFPTFRAPGDIAASAKALGYDSCTTASNHTLDQGSSGVHETLEVLEAAGLHSTGAARSAEEAESQIWLDLGGVRVAHFSYTYSFNGFRLPSDSPWMSNLIDPDEILTRTTQARNDGAEYVIVSLHWGNEYVHTPNYQQSQLGPQLLASPDIDLIIGHHAHVVQPIDRIDDEWLVYGLGNLLSNMSAGVRRDELLVTVTVDEQLNGSFTTSLEVVPLYMDYNNVTVYPSAPSLRPNDLPDWLDQELDSSWDRVRSVLEDGSAWDDLGLPPVS